MSIGEILYTIIIKPLELIFELIFAASYDIIPNPAVNLVIMSLAINLLVLPLYRRADIIQAEAKAKENEIRPMVDHIKRSFKGDEKVMMLQTYYDQRHYHPLSSFKSIISLLLQIPFFMAAYQFLSHLAILDGQRMGPIRDLSQPDGLIVIGSLTINLLPILMTVINIVSSEIYTKGQPFKDKIVLYLSAAIFLVLLYDSPSGLVFYWTFNNIFSLGKNIVYGLNLKKSTARICIIACISILFTALGIYYLVLGDYIMSACNLATVLVIALICILIKMGSIKIPVILKCNDHGNLLFVINAVYLSCLVGLLVPSTVISSSPADFVYKGTLSDPNVYIWNSFCISIGLFAIWCSVYYFLSSQQNKNRMTLLMSIGSLSGTINCLFFSNKLGIISAELVLEDGLYINPVELIVNTLLCLVLIVAIVFVYNKKTMIINALVFALTVTVIAISTMNIISIHKEIDEISRNTNSFQKPEIVLSTKGKNVVVVMIDRAIGSLVPSIFEEQKSLNEIYDGFTYYPNTVSFGQFTNFGIPAVYGGYEYTPEKMNARSDALLKDKHNESLLVMPILFDKNGFETTIIDPPYVNYKLYNDLSIYSQYPSIHAFLAEGMMTPNKESMITQLDESRNHNFFFYGIFKTVPSLLQYYIYDVGDYHSLDLNYQTKTDSEYIVPQRASSGYTATGVNPKFLDASAVLDNLINMTQIKAECDNSFLFLDNETTHAPSQLQAPEYVPSNRVDNTAYYSKLLETFAESGNRIHLSTDYQVSLYQANVYTYLSLGKWFNYLKENGVWDNTRIIIVSDHGRMAGYFDELVFADIGLAVDDVHPVLMVKDFNSHGFTTSDEFMTNADVPTLAMKDVISNPVNPFTNQLINNDDKYTGTLKVLYSSYWNVAKNNGNQFMPGSWYSVHDNIFDRNNWEYLGEY